MPEIRERHALSSSVCHLPDHGMTIPSCSAHGRSSVSGCGGAGRGVQKLRREAPALTLHLVFFVQRKRLACRKLAQLGAGHPLMVLLQVPYGKRPECDATASVAGRRRVLTATCSVLRSSGTRTLTEPGPSHVYAIAEMSPVGYQDDVRVHDNGVLVCAHLSPQCVARRARLQNWRLAWVVRGHTQLVRLKRRPTCQWELKCSTWILGDQDADVYSPALL